MRIVPRLLPHFIIAGAPRSATTWLWTLADRHPEVAIAQPAIPEPKFFLVDSLYERGLDYYSSRWFEPLPSRRVRGEKSANYLENPLVAARIHRDLPDVKLVFLLRNPVDRAYSNFLWSTQNGMENEASFMRALQLEAERERRYPTEWNFSRPYSYFSRGLYAEHLRRFFELFPRERILVLKTEDAIVDARGAAARFHTFIGVEEKPDIADDLGAVNAVVNREAQMTQDARALLEERYRGPNADLQRLLGGSFSLWN